MSTIESLALDLSSALLAARNATPEGTPAHASLASLERDSLALYDAIARLRVEPAPAAPPETRCGDFLPNYELLELLRELCDDEPGPSAANAVALARDLAALGHAAALVELCPLEHPNEQDPADEGPGARS